VPVSTLGATELLSPSQKDSKKYWPIKYTWFNGRKANVRMNYDFHVQQKAGPDKSVGLCQLRHGMEPPTRGAPRGDAKFFF
jgi:hypothetical protein